MSRVSSLARQLLDELAGRATDSGRCIFCDRNEADLTNLVDVSRPFGPRKRHGIVELYRWRGELRPMCSRCITSLGYVVQNRGGCRYKDLRRLRSLHKVPKLVLAEWAAARLLRAAGHY